MRAARARVGVREPIRVFVGMPVADHHLTEVPTVRRPNVRQVAIVDIALPLSVV